ITLSTKARQLDSEQPLRDPRATLLLHAFVGGGAREGWQGGAYGPRRPRPEHMHRSESRTGDRAFRLASDRGQSLHRSDATTGLCPLGQGANGVSAVALRGALDDLNRPELPA